MVKKIINSYFKLLDEKLENGTLVVLIITFMIILVSAMVNGINNNIVLKKNSNEITNQK